MEYNIEYISVKYSLVKAFMFSANKDVLDISYNQIDSKIDIQIILLKGSFLSRREKERVIESLPEFKVSIKELQIAKEQFNENIGEWTPKYFDWLDNVLFSKAEVL